MRRAGERAEWAVATGGLTNTVVQVLAIDPATPVTLYVGTLGRGVFDITQVAATPTPTVTATPTPTATVTVTATATLFARGAVEHRVLGGAPAVRVGARDTRTLGMRVRRSRFAGCRGV